MSFVVYDVETTGLNRRFDKQILHFAAVRTDEKLSPTEAIEIRSRSLPYVVPSPKALMFDRNVAEGTHQSPAVVAL